MLTMWSFANIWYMYLIGVLILVFGVLKGYFANKSKRLAENTVKTIASILFVALGICAVLNNYLYNGSTEHALRFGLWMIGGLLLGLVGDIFLGMRHLNSDAKIYNYFSTIGISFIFLGNILYIIALLVYDKLVFAFIPCMIAMPIFYIGLIYTGKIGKPLNQKIFSIVYFLVLNIIFATSLSLLYKTGWQFGINMPTLIFAGSIIFFISDAVLGIRDETKFKINRPASNYAIIIFYYIAQMLYCFAIYCAQ